MATNYPASTDNSSTLPYPSDTNVLNNPDLASTQSNQNDAVIAIENLVGINSSQTSPGNAGNVLQAVSSVANSWGLLSASNVATLSGSGAFIFGSSPTINSPTIISPNIANPTFTGSLGSVNFSTITASGLITGNSGLMITAGTVSLPTNSITAPELATNAITLGYSLFTATATTNSLTAVALTSLVATVTVPAGSRNLRITGSTTLSNTSTDVNNYLTIWSGTVGSGTQIGQGVWAVQDGVTANNAIQESIIATAIVSVAAGVANYGLGFHNSGAGITTAIATITNPSYILVEMI